MKKFKILIPAAVLLAPSNAFAGTGGPYDLEIAIAALLLILALIIGLEFFIPYVKGLFNLLKRKTVREDETGNRSADEMHDMSGLDSLTRTDMQ